MIKQLEENELAFIGGGTDDDPGTKVDVSVEAKLPLEAAAEYLTGVVVGMIGVWIDGE